jgi:hypothetical protein
MHGVTMNIPLCVPDYQKQPTDLDAWHFFIENDMQ